MHGSDYGLEFFGKEIDVETLCAIIAQRKDYKKGQDIKLIACYTGRKDDGVAQYVANKLGVTVWAPTEKAIINRNIYWKYTVYSGDDIGAHNGEFIPFTPQPKKGGHYYG